MKLQDANNIEAGADSPREYYQSVQSAINSGIAWQFQGFYGRTMMAAIQSGRCMLGTKPTKDAYGNRIPSRFEVEEGTKGSRQYVINHHGEEWADILESAGVPA